MAQPAFPAANLQDKNPGIHDFRHCHADVIRNCSAPCIGRISINDYNRNFDQAVRLLEGTGRKALWTNLPGNDGSRR